MFYFSGRVKFFSGRQLAKQMYRTAVFVKDSTRSIGQPGIETFGTVRRMQTCTAKTVLTLHQPFVIIIVHTFTGYLEI